jgi:hypothetical protein
MVPFLAATYATARAGLQAPEGRHRDNAVQEPVCWPGGVFGENGFFACVQAGSGLIGRREFH